MKYQSNISEIVRLKVTQLEKLKNPDQMLRTVALAVLPELKKRVHVEGKDSAGNQIGNYSPGYMVKRTGSYQNAETYKRGKNVGKTKNAGTYTESVIRLNKQTGVFSGDEKVGKPRVKYNRTADTKVILSLTRQMENDLSVVPSPKGYGIGFKNVENYKKSQWNELTYKKRIWGLTEGERELAIKIADAFVDQQLNES